MIKRFYLENYLSFKEVDIEFKKGLVVFTGPSGSGKSILMDALLALFGIKDAKAAVSEVLLEDTKIENEIYDLGKDDDIYIKEIKKDKTRYFFNNQSLSKKNLKDFSSSLVKYIHVKDNSDFHSEKLITFLDLLAIKEDKKFSILKSAYQLKYLEFNTCQKELNKILEDELKLEELKEFAIYEINKIKEIDPQINEYEELKVIKKTLSKKDKIEEAIKQSEEIFKFSSKVSKTLDLMDKNTSFFDEAINELTSIYEGFADSLYELEDLDIEEVLNRIELLSALEKRFGSIHEALEYKKKKEEELESYENISFSKHILEKKVKRYKIEVKELADDLSVFRVKAAKLLEEKMNYYLKYLYLSNAKVIIEEKNLDESGQDKVVFILNGVNLDTISSGEFNRLRLALLTSMSDYEINSNGILFLDEIDANLSGKESAAIATVLKKLTSKYQIFAISHQPQLTACANQHFLVDKNNNVSCVKELKEKEKEKEIARMISGEKITKEALVFARDLLS
ncbi:MAG: AAA family ATPase [Campylobacterales bacterium]|nr:AAA family ATPase [Campylobacterales bacterium]